MSGRLSPSSSSSPSSQSSSSSSSSSELFANRTSVRVGEYDDPPKYFPRRFQYAALAHFASMLCYVDRVTMSVVVLSIALSPSETGYVLGGFYLGYGMTQVFGGWASERYGGKLVLMLSIFMATLFDVLTLLPATEINHDALSHPDATVTVVGGGVNLLPGSPQYNSIEQHDIRHEASFVSLVLVRMVVGAGCGLNFPTLHHMSSLWIPRAERSRGVAFIMSGQDVGVLLAMLVTPPLIVSLGWQSVELVFAGVSLLCLLMMFLYGAGSPESHHDIAVAEKVYIVRTREDHDFGPVVHVTDDTERQLAEPPSDAHKIMPARHRSLWSLMWYFSGQRRCWAIFIAHSAYSYGWTLLYCWAPKFIMSVLQLELNSTKGLTVLVVPFVIGCIGVGLSGMLGDALITYGWHVLTVRKLMSAIGLFGPFLFFLLAAFDPLMLTPVDTLVLFSIILFTLRFNAAGFWVNVIDVAGPHAGTLLGMSMLGTTVPSVVVNFLAGYWIEVYSKETAWTIIFAIAAFVHLFGAFMFLLFASDRPLEYLGVVQDDEFEDEQEERTSLLSDPDAHGRLTPPLPIKDA